MELKDKLAARRRELEAASILERRAQDETAAAATIERQRTQPLDTSEVPSTKAVLRKSTTAENWGTIFFFGGLIGFLFLPWWVCVGAIILGLAMLGKKN